MVRKNYIPDRGDIVWLNFDPVKGHEQQGPRPAVIISPRRYNAMAEISLACPITSVIKRYPFEVNIETPKVKGVILCDQIRAVAWRDRKAKFIASVPKETMVKVTDKIRLLIS